MRTWRRRLLGAALLFTALAAVDLTRPPPDQLSARVLLAAIDVYQATLSRLLARTGRRCRFDPSCSHFAEGAIEKDGALVGIGRAVWRVLRCGPWTPHGTVDLP